MNVYNFSYGVRFTEAAAPENTNLFYGKNEAHLSLDVTGRFELRDNRFYQLGVGFVRTDIAAIFDNGAPVVLPVTDAALYELLCSYLYADYFKPTIYLTPTPNLPVVNISGGNYTPVLADHGKHFIFDTPTAGKTFTISAGLPVGWFCWVTKANNGNTTTVNGAGGMVIVGNDLILNNQWSTAKIVVIAPLQALVQNIGG